MPDSSRFSFNKNIGVRTCKIYGIVYKKKNIELFGRIYVIVYRKI